jgi:hypothetical protein
MNQNFSQLANELALVADDIVANDEYEAVVDADIEKVLTAAVKLYCLKADMTRNIPPPVSDRITPTEVAMIACEMMRVVDLNPFDLSMWYRRAR